MNGSTSLLNVASMSSYGTIEVMEEAQESQAQK